MKKILGLAALKNPYGKAWLLIATFCAAVAVPGTAWSCSSSERVVHYVEFAPGSWAVSDASFIQLLYRITRVRAGRPVDSYRILASGDLAEGMEWQHAAPRARERDRRLGRARVNALRNYLRRLPRSHRARVITHAVRANRQVFTADEQTANPALTDRLRAVVVADLRFPRLPQGQPVPLC
jgi:hypothetical protein